MDFGSVRSFRIPFSPPTVNCPHAKSVLKSRLFRVVGRPIIFIQSEIGRKNRCRRCFGFHNEVIFGKYDLERKVITFHISIKEQQFISNFSLAQAQARYNEAIDREIYGSDEFRMYGFKIKRCTRMYSHDWTDCPYAHHGENAQRRDPRKYPYNTIVCPDFRDDGGCPRGDNCQFAHGVFEYWLHPARYRTRVCTEGRFCSRKVCFFAHSPDQLRFEPKYKSPKLANKGKMPMMDDTAGDHQPMMMVGSPSGAGEASTSTAMQAHCVEPSSPLQLEGLSCLLDILRTMKMREDEARKQNNNNNKNNNNSFFSDYNNGFLGDKNSFFGNNSSSNNNNSFFGNSSSSNNNNNFFAGNNTNNNNRFFAGNFNSFLGRGIGVADSDLPHMDWVSDILK